MILYSYLITSSLCLGSSICLVYFSESHSSSLQHAFRLPLNLILLMTIPKLGAVIKSLTATKNGQIGIIIQFYYNYYSSTVGKNFSLSELD